MYEELVTALRKRAHDLPEKFSKNAENVDLFMKATDAIAELQERIAASEVTIKRQSDIIQAKDRDLQRAIDAKPQWIPVTARLPEQSGKYHAFALGEENTMDFYDGHWMLCGTDYRRYVTHWMPCQEPPEPPKEE